LAWAFDVGLKHLSGLSFISREGHEGTSSDCIIKTPSAEIIFSPSYADMYGCSNNYCSFLGCKYWIDIEVTVSLVVPKEYRKYSCYSLFLQVVFDVRTLLAQLTFHMNTVLIWPEMSGHGPAAAIIPKAVKLAGSGSWNNGRRAVRCVLTVKILVSMRDHPCRLLLCQIHPIITFIFIAATY